MLGWSKGVPVVRRAQLPRDAEVTVALPQYAVP